MSHRAVSGSAIEKVDVSCYTVPTDAPEADGTFDWQSTTLVMVEATGGHCTGLGYSYTDGSAARLIADVLSPEVVGRNAFDIPGAHAAMLRRVRNLGRAGLAATAISAVDTALWDLKARLLGISLLDMIGSVREAVPVYGSGGFTSYSDAQLCEQLGGWAAAGLRAVKIKLGRAPDAPAELHRVETARAAIGDGVELFVDANGAYERKQALAMAERLAEYDVRWFEEPVSSDDLEGLRLLRDRAPSGMRIAAGEYGYNPQYFRRMLEAGSVDVMQADATRCLGLTGFLAAGAVCEAFTIPLSFHCAPALHASAACALPAIVHGEYFHDHARIENLFFEGAPLPVNGVLRPARDRPGQGWEFKRADAERYRTV